MSFGRCVTRALGEAAVQFGKGTPDNLRERTRWVQARVKELQAQPGEVAPYAPKDFDVKARQAGEDS